MAGTIVVDRIESDASYTSTINVANKITFSNTVNFGVFAGTAPVAGFYLPTTNNLAFTTASTERMRLNSTGALVFAGGTTTADGIGITFPATQSASSNANTLDDYEEGTWTPSVTSMTTTGTPAYAGMYTKIGRVVTVTFYTTTASGAVATYATIAGTTNVSGLPFSANAVIPNAAAGFAGIAINGNTNTGGFVQGPNSGTTFYFNSAITASQGLSVSITYYAST